MKNITPRMFRRTLTTLALTSMLASLTACTGTTTAMDTAIRQPQVTATARTDTNLPDHIVNGGFDYPDMSMLGARDSLFVYISRKDLSYARKDTQDKTNPADPPRFALPSGFDASGFAWHSTQGNTGLANEKPDDVQVWTVYDGGNHYAELAAAQTGTAIYQDIATEPGVMYKWSLRHASLDEAYLDKMSVMIGTPGKETAQDAVRVTSNGHGDKTGPVGKIIATKVANHRNAQSWNKETDHTGAMGIIRGHVHRDRQDHSVHVQERGFGGRPRRQPARRHHLHQGVPALLRREREHEWKRPAKQVEKRQQ